MLRPCFCAERFCVASAQQVNSNHAMQDRDIPRATPVVFIELLILPLLSANLAEATAAEDDLSSEPPGFVGGEKRSDPDVLGHASPAERSQRLDRVCDLIVGVHGTCALGVDYA